MGGNATLYMGHSASSATKYCAVNWQYYNGACITHRPTLWRLSHPECLKWGRPLLRTRTPVHLRMRFSMYILSSAISHRFRFPKRGERNWVLRHWWWRQFELSTEHSYSVLKTPTHPVTRHQPSSWQLPEKRVGSSSTTTLSSQHWITLIIISISILFVSTAGQGRLSKIPTSFRSASSTSPSFTANFLSPSFRPDFRVPPLVSRSGKWRRVHLLSLMRITWPSQPHFIRLSCTRIPSAWVRSLMNAAAFLFRSIILFVCVCVCVVRRDG